MRTRRRKPKSDEYNSNTAISAIILRGSFFVCLFLLKNYEKYGIITISITVYPIKKGICHDTAGKITEML